MAARCYWKEPDVLKRIVGSFAAIFEMLGWEKAYIQVVLVWMEGASLELFYHTEAVEEDLFWYGN